MAPLIILAFNWISAVNMTSLVILACNWISAVNMTSLVILASNGILTENMTSKELKLDINVNYGICSKHGIDSNMMSGLSTISELGDGDEVALRKGKKRER